MANTNRLRHIDILKGIGILAVIFFHIFANHKWGLHYSATFKLPIFFFLSGYLFKMVDFKTFVIRKFNGLIKPYFYFGAINLAVCLLTHKISSFSTYFERFFWINNHTTLFIAGALWFLTALFFVNIFAWLIYKYRKYYISIAIFLILLTLEFIYKVKLPYSMDSALYMVVIFFAGYGFRKIERDFKYQLLYAIALIGISSLSIAANGMGGVNLRMTVFNNLLLFYIFAIIGVLGYYYLSKVIQKYKISNVLEYCGRNSLYFMCYSEMITYILKISLHMHNRTLLFFATCLIIYLILQIQNLIKQKFNNRFVEVK